MMQIDGRGSRKVLVRAVLAGTACSGDGDVSDFHGTGTSSGEVPVHEKVGKKARVSAVSMRKRVRARGERMRGCGVAVMSDLDGGSGGSVHTLLAVHGRTESGEGECGVVWCFQRGRGWFL